MDLSYLFPVFLLYFKYAITELGKRVLSGSLTQEDIKRLVDYRTPVSMDSRIIKKTSIRLTENQIRYLEALKEGKTLLSSEISKISGIKTKIVRDGMLNITRRGLVTRRKRKKKSDNRMIYEYSITHKGKKALAERQLK